MRLAFIIVLLFIAAFANNAYAHNPYTRDIKNINFGEEKCTIQKLYGDGIFFADPVSLQIKNHVGGVIAYTEVGRQVSAFCWSESICWGFVFGGFGPLPVAYKFKPEEASWDTSNSFESYPEFAREGENLGFEQISNPFMSLLGMLMLVKDCYIYYLTLFVLLMLSRLLFKRAMHISKSERRKIAVLLESILYGALQGAIWIIVFIMVLLGEMYEGIPGLLSIGVLIGIYFLLVGIKRFKVKKLHT